MRMQSPEVAVVPTTNTYSLRVRKSAAIDRDYSPSPPAGQPVKKRPRVQQQTTPRKGPGRRAANAAIAPRAAAAQIQPIEDPYLVAIRIGKSATALVDKWMREYEESPDQAIVAFLQFLVASCGCSGKLDANMVHNMEMKTVITRLSEFFEEDSGDYPIIMITPQWKKFRNSFGDFITLFIIRCKNSVLFDVTMMDSLIQLLTGLSESSIRAFRHTATFAAMKISSAIVDVVVELIELKEKNATQIETEKAKLAQMGTNERLDFLLQQKAELDTKVDELSAMIQYMFRSVFVHRYRDVVSDIRTICITELGNWVRVYPALFLDDAYLKYIGWTLCDKVPEVRLRCVTALLPLYTNFVLIERLELFTNKFKDRLASMVMDSETEVATKACQLLTCIYRAFPALLSPRDCVPVYELVYCNKRELAVAAAGFINAKLLCPPMAVVPIAGDGVDMEGVEPAVDNRQLLKDLVSFYKDAQVHNHPAYLVDSFIDICPLVKDWVSMVQILLANEAYENEAELIAIMSAAAKQAATGEHPPNRIVISIRRGPGAGTEKKDLRQLHEERVRLSEVFIPTLPRLLDKFIADQEMVLNLLDIFLHFDLDIYAAGRHDQPLNEFMQLIERVVEQYSSEEVIKQVAAIFQFIATNMAVSAFTEVARVRLIDGIANQLRRQLQQVQQQHQGTSSSGDQQNVSMNMSAQTLDEEDEAALLSMYRKMVAFTAAIDVPAKWNFWDQTIELLNRCGRQIRSADLVEKAVLLCFQTLTWDTKRIVTVQNLDEATIETMRQRRDQFLKLTRGILRNEASGVENAFMCLCDTLILYNWKLAADFGPDHPAHLLAFKPDRETQLYISAFVQDNVFVENDNERNQLEQHAQIQLLAKRRNILAHYIKLFFFGVLPIIDIAAILRYFIKFYPDFGDIFKHLLQECRKLDKATTAKAIIKALINEFEELKLGGGAAGDDDEDQLLVDQDSEQFQQLRELAKRFALSFGVDNIKNREALAMIHHNGIKYALQLETTHRNARNQQQQPIENFPFFEVLQEFSPKLHRQDKLAVLRYLDKYCSQDKKIDNEDMWQTFQLYRSSLAKAE